MNGLLVPRKNHGYCERHLTRTINPYCEKPHTHYATNIRDPYIILITQFTTKVMLITFLNERGKLSALKFEDPFFTHVTKAVRVI
jgi:hypothetical protein